MSLLTWPDCARLQKLMVAVPKLEAEITFEQKEMAMWFPRLFLTLFGLVRLIVYDIAVVTHR